MSVRIWDGYGGNGRFMAGKGTHAGTPVAIGAYSQLPCLGLLALSTEV
jgi:hypothetical protein